MGVCPVDCTYCVIRSPPKCVNSPTGIELQAKLKNDVQYPVQCYCTQYTAVEMPSAVLWRAQCSAVHCSAVHCCAVHCSAAQCCPVFCWPVSWECISQIALLSAAVTSFTNTSRPLGGGALQTPMQRVETEKGPKINLREKKLVPSWKSMADKQTKSSSCIDRSGTRRKY